MLSGKTIFISGASRGIGEAIAFRCAKEKANIVIAAKTAEPHPKLPGTIYTAAKLMEEAGGKALPCVVDIRSEEAVKSAIQSAVDKFGGIDILVNNASAIQLTGTEATSMSRFDLMTNVNFRGTFLCSKYAIPHLKKSSNPHILNISPPLNMKPHWFKNHCAYTVAKYGMSMCALGMAEEFREAGVAVNCLWPRTAIYTAAMEMLGGGEEIKSQCRKPDIMADAAFFILTKGSRNFTGNFCIDDEVLASEGITDMEPYSYMPGNLLPDFFLDHEPEKLVQQMKEGGAKPAFEVDSTSSSPVEQIFAKLKTMINPELIAKIKGTYSFELDSGKWYLDLKNGSGSCGRGDIVGEKSDTTMTMNDKNFVKLFEGNLNSTTAFMTGKLKIKGNMGTAMKLENLLKSMKSKL